jgi:hypothetical protein
MKSVNFNMNIVTFVLLVVVLVLVIVYCMKKNTDPIYYERFSLSSASEVMWRDVGNELVRDQMIWVGNGKDAVWGGWKQMDYVDHKVLTSGVYIFNKSYTNGIHYTIPNWTGDEWTRDAALDTGRGVFTNNLKWSLNELKRLSDQHPANYNGDWGMDANYYPQFNIYNNTQRTIKVQLICGPFSDTNWGGGEGANFRWDNDVVLEYHNDNGKSTPPSCTKKDAWCRVEQNGWPWYMPEDFSVNILSKNIAKGETVKLPLSMERPFYVSYVDLPSSYVEVLPSSVPSPPPSPPPSPSVVGRGNRGRWRGKGRVRGRGSKIKNCYGFSQKCTNYNYCCDNKQYDKPKQKCLAMKNIQNDDNYKNCTIAKRQYKKYIKCYNNLYKKLDSCRENPLAGLYNEYKKLSIKSRNQSSENWQQEKEVFIKHTFIKEDNSYKIIEKTKLPLGNLNVNRWGHYYSHSFAAKKWGGRPFIFKNAEKLTNQTIEIYNRTNHTIMIKIFVKKDKKLSTWQQTQGAWTKGGAGPASHKCYIPKDMANRADGQFRDDEYWCINEVSNVLLISKKIFPRKLENIPLDIIPTSEVFISYTIIEGGDTNINDYAKYVQAQWNVLKQREDSVKEGTTKSLP